MDRLPGVSARVDLSEATTGTFAYGGLATPVTLQANTTYYLVSQEVQGGDHFYSTIPVTPTSVAQFNGSTYRDGPGNYVEVSGVPNISSVPVSFSASIEFGQFICESMDVMTRRSLLDSLSLLAVAGAAPRFALGQGSAQRKSPHETVSLEVGGKQISITYGRPSLKGRTAFAAGELAPSGQVWRLGADEATKLVLTGAAMLNGTLATPAGSYALFAIPGDSQWTVIVNKTADQWGAFNYDKAQDLGRFPCPVRKAGHTEEFTIALANTSGKGATVSMAWQDAQVSFPIQFR